MGRGVLGRRTDWVLVEHENAYSIKWLKPVSSGPKILRSTLLVEQKSVEDSKPTNCEDTIWSIWIANLWVQRFLPYHSGERCSESHRCLVCDDISFHFLVLHDSHELHALFPWLLRLLHLWSKFWGDANCYKCICCVSDDPNLFPLNSRRPSAVPVRSSWLFWFWGQRLCEEYIKHKRTLNRLD